MAVQTGGTNWLKVFEKTHEHRLKRFWKYLKFHGQPRVPAINHKYKNSQE